MLDFKRYHPSNHCVKLLSRTLRREDGLSVPLSFLQQVLAWLARRDEDSIWKECVGRRDEIILVDYFLQRRKDD